MDGPALTALDEAVERVPGVGDAPVGVLPVTVVADTEVVGPGVAEAVATDVAVAWAAE